MLHGDGRFSCTETVAFKVKRAASSKKMKRRLEGEVEVEEEVEKRNSEK